MKILILCLARFEGGWKFYIDPILESLLCVEKIQLVQFEYYKYSKNKIIRAFQILFPLSFLFKVKKLLKKETFNCIYYPASTFSIIKPHWILGKKLKTIGTIHDLINHQEHKLTLALWYIFKFRQRHWKNCDALCTSSHAQEKKLKRMFPNKLIFFHSLPTFVNENIIKGKAVCQELAGQRNYILFFGNVNLYKGIEILYEAYLKSNLNEALVVAGKFSADYNPIPNKSNNVILINRRIEENEIRSLFENAKCVVYPYISITQSGILSFPYYFKIPVITSDLDYFKEQIIDKKSGLLFENKNSNDLAKKLISIFDGSIDLEEMKTTQKEQYEKCFSKKQLQNELMEMFSGVLGVDNVKEI